VSTLPYFRPPYGDYDDLVNADVFARGYRYNVMWSVDSMGWYGYEVPKIIETVMDEVSPGAIIIMHVGASSQDGPALQQVITRLKDAGYSFVPLTAIAPP
jgi:peptidoglycan/xylan/chitin deacetylase (PgdA/CDA1 family)